MTSNRHHNEYPDGAACFWTSSVVGFVPVLHNETAAKCLLGIWDHYRRVYNVKLLGYGIMPNHFHLVVRSDKGDDVRRFLRRTLGLSSLEIGGLVERAAAGGDILSGSWMKVFTSHAGSGSKVAIWKERGRAFPVASRDVMRQKLTYMHGNPVRMGLVPRPEDWKLSSAAWYERGEGPIVVDEVPGW
jgi:REP element-mobilizing transposase RayT